MLRLIYSLSLLLCGGFALCVEVSALPSEDQSRATAEISTDWREISPDLEILEMTTTSGIFSAALLFTRTNLKKYRIKAARLKDYGLNRGTAKAIANLTGGVVAINANFFDPSGEPLGLVVSRGISLNSIHRGGKALTGIFQVTEKRLSIINRSNFVTDGVIEAIQAGPRLILKGQAVQGLRESNTASRRAGLCLDKEGRLILFCSRSALGGISMNELQGILLNPKVNCVDALNLDGGGSAQLYINVKDKNERLLYEEFLPGRDSVPVGLVLQEIQ